MKINDDMYYNLSDICDVFKLNYQKIKQQLSDYNTISFRKTNLNKSIILINNEDLLSLAHELNNTDFKIFSNYIIRNVLSENMFDRNKNCIILDM